MKYHMYKRKVDVQASSRSSAKIQQLRNWTKSAIQLALQVQITHQGISSLGHEWKKSRYVEVIERSLDAIVKDPDAISKLDEGI